MPSCDGGDWSGQRLLTRMQENERAKILQLPLTAEAKRAFASELGDGHT